jgi:hypothetical protein
MLGGKEYSRSGIMRVSPRTTLQNVPERELSSRDRIFPLETKMKKTKKIEVVAIFQLAKGLVEFSARIANGRFHFSSPEVSTVYAAKLREISRAHKLPWPLPRFGRNSLIRNLLILLEDRYLK